MLARAIARDVYGQDRVAQVIAYLTAAYVLGPMFAPLIGGHLTVIGRGVLKATPSTAQIRLEPRRSGLR